MSPLLFPYGIAVAAGAAFALLGFQFGPIVAAALGVAAAIGYSFGPPLPGARREWDRIGRTDTTQAIGAFFFAAACVVAALLVLPNLDHSTLDPRERLIATRLYALMTWGAGVGALVWGVFCVRPRRRRADREG